MLMPEGTSRGPLRSRLRPYTDQVAGVPALLVLLGSMLRRGRRELWIGDSHAVCFLRGGSWAVFLTGPRREIILRVGARLMYSLGRAGFPPRVHRLARNIGRFGRRDSFVPIFVAGEIDVRNALAEHPDTDFAFVDAYLDSVGEVAGEMRVSTAYVVVPPPPRPAADLDPAFPCTGTDAERLAAFHGLRRAMTTAVGKRADLVLLDFGNVLAGPDGMLLPHLTDDGCHTNAAAHPLIRTELSRHTDFRSGRRGA